MSHRLSIDSFEEPVNQPVNWYRLLPRLFFALSATVVLLLYLVISSADQSVSLSSIHAQLSLIGNLGSSNEQSINQPLDVSLHSHQDSLPVYQSVFQSLYDKMHRPSNNPSMPIQTISQLTKQPICTVPIPNAPEWSDDPLVPQWRLCPLNHRYPSIKKRSPPPPPAEGFNHSDPEWRSHRYPAQTPYEWPISYYPRVFVLDPFTRHVYALLIHEVSYDLTPGYWSAVSTMYLVDSSTGQWMYTQENPFEMGHVAVDARPLMHFNRWLMCESVDGVRHLAEVEVTKFHITLKCPYTHRPKRPEHAIDQTLKQTSKQSENYWAFKTQDEHSVSQFNDFRMRSQVRFFHPFFANARYKSNQQSANQPINVNVGSVRDFNQSRDWDMAPVNERMNYLKGLVDRFVKDTSTDFVVEQMLEQQSADQSNNQQNSKQIHSLDAEVCLACVPPVDVTLCAAPFTNQALVNQIHSSTAYHTGLGIQRHTIYDRWGWYEAVLSPYIKSGLIDYHPKPLPFDTLLDRVEYEHSAIYGMYFDQSVSIETCRVRAFGVSEWISYKDTDEWLVFPRATTESTFDHSNDQRIEQYIQGSFIRSDRIANCIDPTWKQSDLLMTSTRGEKNYIHVSAGKQYMQSLINQKNNQSIPSTSFPSSVTPEDLKMLTDSSSVYSYYQPDAAVAFLNIDRNTQNQKRGGRCVSQLSAWLQALDNLNLYQARTQVPQITHRANDHHSPDHRVPAALPNIVDPEKDPPSVRIGEYVKAGSMRMDWIGLCDVIMGGVASVANHPLVNAGASASSHQLLMIEEWQHRKPYHPQLLNSSPHLKWFSRPHVTTLSVHMAHNARGDMRPCDEIRFNHYKNFPYKRVGGTVDERDWMKDSQVVDFYYSVIEGAGQPPHSFHSNQTNNQSQSIFIH